MEDYSAPWHKMQDAGELKLPMLLFGKRFLIQHQIWNSFSPGVTKVQ